MSLPCYRDIKDAGAEDALKRIYGSMLVEPEPRNDISLDLDLNNLPGSAGTTFFRSLLLLLLFFFFFLSLLVNLSLVVDYLLK